MRKKTTVPAPFRPFLKSSLLKKPLLKREGSIPFAWLFLLGVTFNLTGCNNLKVEPLDKSASQNDMPAGPGLFTGETGEWVIHPLDHNSEDPTENTSRKTTK